MPSSPAHSTSPGPFAKTGARRTAPKANIAKPADKFSSERMDKLAELQASANAANVSVMMGAEDQDATGHVDTKEYAEHIKKTQAEFAKSPPAKSTKSRLASTGGSSATRRRPAIPPPARASAEVPRYFETTQLHSFRQYSVVEMRDAMPWKDKRDGKGDRFDENELREQWHTSETPNWDYTANNERNEKISFTHGDKWGLNHTNAGGDRGAF